MTLQSTARPSSPAADGRRLGYAHHVPRLLLAGIFLASSFGKLVFPSAHDGPMGLLFLSDNLRLAGVVATLVALLEGALGIMLLCSVAPRLVSAVALTVCVAFSAIHLRNILTGGPGVVCGCFGSQVRLTSAAVAVVVGVMNILAALNAVIVAGAAGPRDHSQ